MGVLKWLAKHAVVVLTVLSAIGVHHSTEWIDPCLFSKPATRTADAFLIQRDGEDQVYVDVLDDDELDDELGQLKVWMSVIDEVVNRVQLRYEVSVVEALGLLRMMTDQNGVVGVIQAFSLLPETSETGVSTSVGRVPAWHWSSAR